MRTNRIYWMTEYRMAAEVYHVNGITSMTRTNADELLADAVMATRPGLDRNRALELIAALKETLPC